MKTITPMKRAACSWATLLLLCSANLSSQSLFVGGNGLYSAFNYSVNGNGESIRAKAKFGYPLLLVLSFLQAKSYMRE